MKLDLKVIDTKHTSALSAENAGQINAPWLRAEMRVLYKKTGL